MRDRPSALPPWPVEQIKEAGKRNPVRNVAKTNTRTLLLGIEGCLYYGAKGREREREGAIVTDSLVWPIF